MWILKMQGMFRCGREIIVNFSRERNDRSYLRFYVGRGKKGRSRICFSSHGVYRQEFISSEKKNIPIASVVAVQTAGWRPPRKFREWDSAWNSKSGIFQPSRRRNEPPLDLFLGTDTSAYYWGRLRNVIYVKGAAGSEEFLNFTGKIPFLQSLARQWEWASERERYYGTIWNSTDTSV